MKTALRHCLIALKLLALSTLVSQPSTACAQGTAFTYQGLLYDGANRATGSYALTFALFTDSNGVNRVGGTLTNTATEITNGVFTVVLDFGSGIFTGTPLWLQIGAKTNGASSFTTLSPLQLLTPTPYAVYSSNAGSAASASLASTAATANGVAAGSVTGAGIAGNSVVKSLNNLQDAVTLSPGANVTITPSGNTLTIASSDGGGNNWLLTGNSGTVPGVNFLGTTDDQPLELHVNGTLAFRLVPGYIGDPNVVGGSGNSVGLYADAVTIAGGSENSISGQNAAIGGGYLNTATNNFATTAGGEGNIAAGNASTVGGGGHSFASGDYATIGGGYGNQATGPGSCVGGGGYDGTSYGGNTAGGGASTVGGGILNLTSANYTTIGGGYGNQANGENSVIGGGGDNTVTIDGYASNIGGGNGNTNSGFVATIGGGNGNNASGIYATIGGGNGNNASGTYGTIPGGYANVAGGNGSFAAGQNAAANDDHSFVWGDGTRAAASQGSNSFAALATGGVWFYTDRDSNAGAKLAPGATSWSVISDRTAKKNFQDVDTVGVLEKLAAIPIQQWNYKWEKDGDVPNIGPMAQDFKTAFYPGRDDKSITTLEFDGVELAAIQGLNQKVNEKDVRIQEQASEIAELQQSVAELKKLVQTLAERK